jgi:hypothetical protein
MKAQAHAAVAIGIPIALAGTFGSSTNKFQSPPQRGIAVARGRKAANLPPFFFVFLDPCEQPERLRREKPDHVSLPPCTIFVVAAPERADSVLLQVRTERRIFAGFPHLAAAIWVIMRSLSTAMCNS